MYAKVFVKFEFDSSDVGLLARLTKVVDSGSVNLLAGPGVPLCVFGSTNGDVLSEHRHLVLALAMTRLRLWRDHTISIYDTPPLSLLEMGFADAIRLFVKDEPHPVEKIEQGRFRLISSCSLITQLCERVVFTDCFEKQVDEWYNCPSMVGIGFSDPMTKIVWDIASRVPRLIQTDVSGWDWSVFHELADGAAAVLCRINDTNAVHHKMICVAIQCLMNAVFTTSAGGLYCLDQPGVMKSGSFITTLLNSLMRVLSSVLVSLEFDRDHLGHFAISVGDDCCEQLCVGETLEVRRLSYQKLGMRITDYRLVPVGTSFEFCSHLYRHDGKAELVSWPRCLYRLLNLEPSHEQFAQFRYELRHNSNLKVLIKFLEYVDWTPPEISQEFGGAIVNQCFIRQSVKLIVQGVGLDKINMGGKTVEEVEAKRKPRARKSKKAAVVHPAKTNIPGRQLALVASAGSGVQARPALRLLKTPQLASMPAKLMSREPGRKIGLGAPNKIGAGIERLGHVKNLSPMPMANMAHETKAVTYLKKMLQPGQCLPPDVESYTALLDDPFRAPWGDDGEIQVKPSLYQDIVPPSTTTTCRQFGQMTISLQPSEKAFVFLCIGAGNQQDLQVVDSDTTRYAAPCVSSIGALANGLCWTPGAPNDQRVLNGIAQNGGRGVAGYWYKNTSLNFAPNVDVASGGVVQTLHGSFQAGNLLNWGSPPPYGDMEPDESSQYKFRPIAGGLIVTPASAELNVGGEYNVSIVPQATNASFVGPPVVGNGHGTAASVADFYALPDHAIHRADGTLEVAWLPSRQDYDFLQTHQLVSNGAGVFTPTPLVTTEVANARVIVEIIAAPDATATQTYVLSYVGFYEVAGRCIQTSGTVPRPQPSVGAKVATSVQNSLNKELSAEEREHQISKGTALEVMKDHPKIGPMISTAETPKDAESIFDKILEVGKTILPFAALLL